ncbi:MAG TPA: hypothetical protein VKE71_10045 [Candidatus Angelobacter sp.]|nr:hypothetical protein [Candidatus Angelobacter sp.]
MAQDNPGKQDDKGGQGVAAGRAASIEFPAIAIGPVEHVLGFNSDEQISLQGFPANPFFTVKGVITDLHADHLPGTSVETAFPLDPALLGTVTQWPDPQSQPFNQPPVDNKNTTSIGYSKQSHNFGNNNTIVAVGPSLPKLTLLKNGGAQFWVSTAGVISQGTGKFEGARGEACFSGSAYFPKWPSDQPSQIKILQAGFSVRVCRFIKYTLKQDLA